MTLHLVTARYGAPSHDLRTFQTRHSMRSPSVEALAARTVALAPPRFMHSLTHSLVFRALNTSLKCCCEWSRRLLVSCRSCSCAAKITRWNRFWSERRCVHEQGRLWTGARRDVAVLIRVHVFMLAVPVPNEAANTCCLLTRRPIL